MAKKYKFSSFQDVKAADVAHIVELLRKGQKDAASKAMDELCRSIKGLVHYEAFMLARKIQQEAETPA